MSELEFVRSEIRRRFRINYSAACSAVPYTMCGLDGQSTVEENVSWRDSESGQDAPRLSVPGFAWLLQNILRLQRKHPVWASTTLLGLFFCKHQLKENQTQADECLFSISMLKYIFYEAIENL